MFAAAVVIAVAGSSTAAARYLLRTELPTEAQLMEEKS
jgi:hypothetical protein